MSGPMIWFIVAGCCFVAGGIAYLAGTIFELTAQRDDYFDEMIRLRQDNARLRQEGDNIWR